VTGRSLKLRDISRKARNVLGADYVAIPGAASLASDRPARPSVAGRSL